MKLWRNLIILLVGVGVLIGAYFLITGLSPAEEEPEEPTPSAETVNIHKVAFSDVKQVEIVSNSGSSIVYLPAEQENKWMLQNPPSDLSINTDKVSSNANEFLSIDAYSVIEEKPENLAKYGLEEPTHTMVITLKDNTTKTLMLGDMSTTVGRYFAYSKDSDTVYTIYDYKANAIRADYSSFKTVFNFTFPTEGYTDLIIERSGKDKIEIATETGRTEDKYQAKFSEMKMVTPYPEYDVNQENLSSMVISGLSSISFRSDYEIDSKDYAEYGLDNPWARIWVHYSVAADESTGTAAYEDEKELIISQLKGGKYYAKLSDYDAIYEFPKSMFDFAENINPYYLINRTAFITYIDTADTVTIWANGKQYNARMVHTQGETEDDITTEVYVNDVLAHEDTGKIFYRAIIGLDFDGLYKGTAEPVGEPALKVEIKLLDGSVKVLELIPINEREYSYTLNGKTTFIIKKTEVDKAIAKIDEIASDPTKEVEDIS